MCSVPVDCAEKLFDLVDSFADSAKRKAAVWPLQIILLILCPDIIQDLCRETVDDSKANKVPSLFLLPLLPPSLSVSPSPSVGHTLTVFCPDLLSVSVSVVFQGG